MGYCERCGVELEETVAACPLCGGAVSEKKNTGSREYEIHPDDAVSRKISGRTIYFRIVLLVLFVPILVTAVVDAFVTPGFSWAPIVWISVATLGFALLIPLVVHGVLKLFILDMIAVVVLLFGIDVLTGGSGWFFHIGLPLVASIGVIGAVVVRVIPAVKPLVAIAIVILGGAAICLAVEIVVSVFLHGRVSVVWSPVVLASTLPIGAFLIVFETTVGRYLDLRRRFHL